MDRWNSNGLSESDSGSATPVLVSGANNVVDQENDEIFVVPVPDPLLINAELNTSNLDSLVTMENGLIDEESSKLSNDMTTLCKQLIGNSVSYFADFKAASIK